MSRLLGKTKEIFSYNRAEILSDFKSYILVLLRIYEVSSRLF